MTAMPETRIQARYAPAKARALALWGLGVREPMALMNALSGPFPPSGVPSYAQMRNWVREFRLVPADTSMPWEPSGGVEDLELLPLVSYMVEVAGGVTGGWPTDRMVAWARRIQSVLPNLDTAAVHTLASTAARMDPASPEVRRLDLELLTLASPTIDAYIVHWLQGHHDGLVLDMGRWAAAMAQPSSPRTAFVDATWSPLEAADRQRAAIDHARLVLEDDSVDATGEAWNADAVAARVARESARKGGFYLYDIVDSGDFAIGSVTWFRRRPTLTLAAWRAERKRLVAQEAERSIRARGPHVIQSLGDGNARSFMYAIGRELPGGSRPRRPPVRRHEGG